MPEVRTAMALRSSYPPGRKLSTPTARPLPRVPEEDDPAARSHLDSDLATAWRVVIRRSEELDLREQALQTEHRRLAALAAELGTTIPPLGPTGSGGGTAHQGSRLRQPASGGSTEGQRPEPSRGGCMRSRGPFPPSRPSAPSADAPDWPQATVGPPIRRAPSGRASASLFVGAVAALLAGAATWFLSAPEYTAVAIVRVPSEELWLARDRAGEAQSEEGACPPADSLIYSQEVLSAALASPEVADLAAVRAEPDPLAWLVRSLEIDAASNLGFVRVSLRASTADEAAAILAAVVEVYRERAEGARRDRLEERLAEARAARDDLQSDLVSRRKVLRALASGGAGVARHNDGPVGMLTLQRAAVVREQVELLGNKRRSLQSQLWEKIVQLDRGEHNTAAQDAPRKAIQDEIAALEARLEGLQTRLRPLRAEAISKPATHDMAGPPGSAEIAARQRIAQLEEALGRASVKADKLHDALSTDGTIETVQEATVLPNWRSDWRWAIAGGAAVAGFLLMGMTTSAIASLPDHRLG